MIISSLIYLSSDNTHANNHARYETDMHNNKMNCSSGIKFLVDLR